MLSMTEKRLVVVNTTTNGQLQSMNDCCFSCCLFICPTGIPDMSTEHAKRSVEMGLDMIDILG